MPEVTREQFEEAVDGLQATAGAASLMGASDGAAEYASTIRAYISRLKAERDEHTHLVVKCPDCGATFVPEEFQGGHDA